jgi:O-acetyl-ADP-ribose deacetylase (regulator of RNase III)
MGYLQKILTIIGGECMTTLEKLSFLIHELAKDHLDYDISIPRDEDKAFQLFRALCNLRMPGPVSDEFLKLEGEILEEKTKEKGLVDVKDLKRSAKYPNISLWQGDITRLKCDAIVNAANSQMLGCFQPLHGCIDNIIHTMAGVELRNECARLMEAQGHEEATGQAKITSAYHLPSQYVIHTVGPIVQLYVTRKNKHDLASCYRNCLDLAYEKGLTSIAFCCISTGVFHFPQDQAAKIAVETVNEWLDEHKSAMHVIFNVFKDSDYDNYYTLLEE